jgi:uncharacterized protein
MTTTTLPDYEAARLYALDRLSTELSPDLIYHNLHHTRDQVLPAATLFSKDMGLSAKEQLLVKTAALFHDIGFIEQYKDNEEISATIAASILPDFSYSAADILAIQKMILATRMPQQPQSVMEQILCDADLSPLGQDIFFETSMMLRRETTIYLNAILIRDWFTEQYTFLASHRYFTSSARRLLDQKKEKNLSELLLLLEAPKASQYQL